MILGPGRSLKKIKYQLNNKIKKSNLIVICLNNTKISPIDAENYLKKYIKIDTVDGEHYSTDVHNAIAKRYIPYVKEKAW